MKLHYSEQFSTIDIVFNVDNNFSDRLHMK